MKMLPCWIALVFLLNGATAPVLAGDFERDKWLADLDQLKAELARGYPNFEWAAKRGMDLPGHEKRARDRLAAATDDAAARVALERFVAGFGDGHLELVWPAVAKKETPGAGPAETAPAPICAQLGYGSRPDTAAIARGLPGYRELMAGGARVAAGVIEADKRKVGVLRISEFSADTSMCERAIHQLNVGSRPACEEQCLRDVEHRTDALLVEFIEAAVRQLVAEKVDVILVDVAGNGGGNDSAIAAARMLTATTLPTPRMRFLRSEARARELQQDAGDLRGYLAKADAATRAFLTPLVAKLDQAVLEAKQPCDLSPLWLGQPAKCSNLLSAPFFAGGLIGDELPAGLRGQPWAEDVSTTARYQFTAGLWNGPVWILVDGNSASATELLTAMLQDAGKARVIGAPTFGAGCGWTLPRQPRELSNSHGKLTMPDCARERRDGTNELDGIQPDVLIGFRRFDSPAQRIRRFDEAWRKVLSDSR